MNQIASALNYMHERRIMHRDLKPANIFIASDNSLKIGDLGLGREFSSETILAYSKVGTPLYMSPEVKPFNCSSLSFITTFCFILIYDFLILSYDFFNLPFFMERQISLINSINNEIAFSTIATSRRRIRYEI